MRSIPRSEESKRIVTDEKSTPINFFQKAVNVFLEHGFPKEIKDRIRVYENPDEAYARDHRSPLIDNRPDTIIRKKSTWMYSRKLDFDFFITTFNFKEFDKHLHTYKDPTVKQKRAPVPILVTQLRVLQGDMQIAEEHKENVLPLYLQLTTLLMKENKENSNHPMFKDVIFRLSELLSVINQVDIATIHNVLLNLDKNLIGGLAAIDSLNIALLQDAALFFQAKVPLKNGPFTFEKLKTIITLTTDHKLDQWNSKQTEEIFDLLCDPKLRDDIVGRGLITLQQNRLLEYREQLLPLYLANPKKFMHVLNLIILYANLKNPVTLIKGLMDVPFDFAGLSFTCSPNTIFSEQNFRLAFSAPVELAPKRLRALIFLNFAYELAPGTSTQYIPHFIRTLTDLNNLGPHVDVIAQARWLCLAPYQEVARTVGHYSGALGSSSYMLSYDKATNRGCNLMKTLENILDQNPRYQPIAVELASVLVELSLLSLVTKENIELLVQHAAFAERLAKIIYYISADNANLFETNPTLLKTLCGFLSSPIFFGGFLDLHKNKKLTLPALNLLMDYCTGKMAEQVLKTEHPALPTALIDVINSFFKPSIDVLKDDNQNQTPAKKI